MSEAVIGVVGNDATVVNDAVHDLVVELLGGLDPAIALEDFVVGSDGGDDATSSVISRVLDALNTPPFLVERRLVVLREVGSLGADDTEHLVAWSQSPTPGVTLVAASSGGRGGAKLLKAASRTVDVKVGSRPQDRQAFVLDRFSVHHVRTGPAVAQRVAERLGDDVARVDSLARTLYAIYGSAMLGFEQIESYLGEAGGVPEWDLTDAIDQGHVAAAIATARRMLDSNNRVGVQITGILQRHYLKMARLDGSGATSGEQAAAIIGGHAFPAQKLIRAARALGSNRIAQCLKLVAQADQDLKGAVYYGAKRDDDVDQTDLTVIEVLVARLAKMSEAARRG
jgi:DNA polymerase-3 subunit delta